jgi:hypothetical protein
LLVALIKEYALQRGDAIESLFQYEMSLKDWRISNMK